MEEPVENVGRKGELRVLLLQRGKSDKAGGRSFERS